MASPESPDRLDISDDARLARQTRRVAALERQVEARIEQVADLRRQLAHAERLVRAAKDEATASALRAVQYDALMATFTMRALRLPRAAYAAARKLVDQRHS